MFSQRGDFDAVPRERSHARYLVQFQQEYYVADRSHLQFLQLCGKVQQAIFHKVDLPLGMRKATFLSLGLLNSPNKQRQSYSRDYCSQEFRYLSSIPSSSFEPFRIYMGGNIIQQ